MHPYLRMVTALCCLGIATMGIVPLGCGSRLGPVRVTQNAGSTGHPNLPDIFVEHAKECVAMDAPKMPPGRVVLNSTVKVNEDGRKEDVTIGDISEEASDLGACLRNALWDLPVVEESFQEGVATLKYWREHASEGHDSLVQFIKVIPGVPIVEGELVLEAEGYTIVLPVTVKVVDKATKPIDLDKVTLEKLGKMAMAALGYEEIMRRAKQVGWVKTVRKIQPKAPAGKGLIAQSETEVVVLMFEVFTEHAVTAGIVSQLDSPLPGPADLAAIGLVALGLYRAGAIAIDALSTSTAPAPTSPPPPPPPSPPPPPPPPPRETCEASELNKIIRCDDPRISSYKFFSETAAYKSIKVKGISKEKSKAEAKRGPCKDRGGWHTNVKQGKDYVASIVGCDCCDDSSGKAMEKERARVDYH